MSKLLTAVVHQGDAEPVADGLRSAGYRFTMVSSVGGFLGEPNTTFMLAVDDDRVDDVLELLEKIARPREVEVPLVLLERLRDWQDRTVSHGGATVLVSDLVQVVRI